MPCAARTLTEYLGSIVVDAITNLEEEPTFRRRWRPGRRRCKRRRDVLSQGRRRPERPLYYSVRDDNGFIQWGCQNSLWDGFAETEQTS